MEPRRPKYDYDVCLSFAGEDRDYVRAVADGLQDRRVRVFYDEYEKVGLWGKDLYSHLDYVYRQAARFCIIFISKHYANKLWTNHERRSAQARAFRENREYLLQARFDDTEIEGILETTGFLDLHGLTPAEFVTLTIAKLDLEPRAGVLVDGDWLLPACRHEKLTLDFMRMAEGLRTTFGDNTRLFFQLTIGARGEDRKRTMKAVQTAGFQTEPLLAARGRSKGFDVRLAIKGNSLPGNIDPVVLVSGDRDLIPLLESIRESGRTAVLVSIQASTSQEMLGASNEAYDLRSFLE